MKFRILGLLLGLVMLFMLYLLGKRAPVIEMDIDPMTIQHQVNYGYYVHLVPACGLFYDVDYDALNNGYASDLVLYENGAMLGPSHSMHDDIRSKGNGQYSHWDHGLYFSASDNSDPRSNGRKYKIIIKSEIKPMLHVFALSIILLVAVVQFTYVLNWLNAKSKNLARTNLFVFWLLNIILATVAFFTYKSIIKSTLLFAIDSDLYLDFGLIRTIGYPFIIKTVRYYFGDLSALVNVQLIGVISSFLYLGYAVYKLTGKWLIGLSLTAALLLNTEVMRYSFSVLTESMFVTFVLIHIASAFMIIMRFTWMSAFICGLSAGAAILMRPAGYSLIISLPVLFLLVKGNRGKFIGYSFCPLLVLILLACFINYASFGIFRTQAFGGLSLIGHTGYLVTEKMQTKYPEITCRLYNRIKPLIENIKTKPYIYEHWWTTANTFNSIWPPACAEINAYIQSNKLADTSSLIDTSIKTEKIAFELALDCIRNNPAEYIKHVLSNVYGMWYTTYHLNGTMKYTIFKGYEYSCWYVSNNPNRVSYFIDVDMYKSKIRLEELDKSKGYETWIDKLWAVIMNYRNLVIVYSAIVSFLFLFIVKWHNRSAMTKSLIYASYVTWIYFFFVSSVQTALDRYAVVFTPIVTFILLMSMYLFVKYLIDKMGISSKSGCSGSPQTSVGRDKDVEIEYHTQKLYADLWGRQDDESFARSIELSRKYVNVQASDVSRKICLDVGCGMGFFVRRLLDLNAEKVFAVDLSVDCVELTRQRNQNYASKLEVSTGNALDLKFEDNSFDVVHCNGVLHHTIDFNKGLSELVRVLKPKGKLYLGLYGSGGLFNAVLSLLRCCAGIIPFKLVNKAITIIYKDCYKQYLALDLLYVPIRQTFTVSRITRCLSERGVVLNNVNHWYGGGFEKKTGLMARLLYGDGYIYFTCTKL